MKKKYLIALFFILFKWFTSYGQAKDNFLLISIDIKNNTKIHPFKRQFLIIELDSMMKPLGKACPVLLSDFSDTQIKSCNLGDTIKIYKTSLDDTFRFDSINHVVLENNYNIVDINKKKILSLKYKYKTYTADITYFYTPIIGSFCSGKINKFDSEILDYNDKIFLVTNEIFINKTFKEKEFLEIDFTKLIDLNKYLF